MYKYIMLEPKNVFDISNIIKETNSNTNFFISPYTEKNELIEQSIRVAMFDYKELYFATVEKETFKNIVCLKILPNPPFKNASAEIKIISNIDEFNDRLFTYIKGELIKYFPNISKITIYNFNNKIDKLVNTFKFTKELTLLKELPDGNIDVYSNYLI
ncbi:hypothetical protein [Clostridium sp. UBA1652]|uniref:hypothetical protein n=1 Tax=Clostridium sp. UBA1652 TaxID=1946348 RepID=UPI00257F55F0|nr:hypothetical protein [Clostridium sp. UBA1652]